MRRGLLAFVFGIVLWGSAVALELPAGEIVVTLGDGTVVGVGEFADGKLELELLAGTTGFVTFTLTGEDGVVASFEIVVGEDGSLTVVESFEDLTSAIVAGGGEVELSFEEEVVSGPQEVDGGEAADGVTGLDRADQMANEQAGDGLARARAARDGDVTGEDEEAGGEAGEAGEAEQEEVEQEDVEQEEVEQEEVEQEEVEQEEVEQEDLESDEDAESGLARAADRGGNSQSDE